MEDKVSEVVQVVAKESSKQIERRDRRILMLEGERKLADEAATRKEQELQEMRDETKEDKAQLSKVIEDVRNAVSKLGGTGLWDNVDERTEEANRCEATKEKEGERSDELTFCINLG